MPIHSDILREIYQRVASNLLICRLEVALTGRGFPFGIVDKLEPKLKSPKATGSFKRSQGLMYCNYLYQTLGRGSVRTL
jgi:hypothetical protein